MPEGALPVAPGAGLTVGLVVGRPLTVAHEALHCGVRDYAIRLAQALGDVGVAARVVAPANWGPSDGLPFVRALRRERFDVLHLQYPSIGHRHSLLPHLLGPCAGARRFVATLHEHSVLPRAQRAANHVLRLTADRLVFTTDHEGQAFGATRYDPIIPIGSNIPVYPEDLLRGNTVLYFGQIRPDKGLEDFIELAALALSAGDPGHFIVMGSAPPRWREHGAALREKSPANVDWLEDAAPPVVARQMAVAQAAYLPFPDGASLRRGSLLAALSNGLPIMAPFGPGTTQQLQSVLLRADGPRQALDQLRALRADSARGQERSLAGRSLAQRFGWSAIADAHVALYRDLLASPMHGRPVVREST